jgi:nucleotide-binding universal stress UspA family protein
MLKVLVPIDGSATSNQAVKHIISMQPNHESMEVHLLNVQHPLSRDMSRFFSSGDLAAYHHEQSEKALEGALSQLKAANIPVWEHSDVGDSAESIVEYAKNLKCDAIIMGSGRKNAFTRLLESSVTNRVMELSPVPVEVVPGEQESTMEKVGLPAGAGLGLGLTIWYLASE